MAERRAILSQNLKTITSPFKGNLLDFRKIADKISSYLKSQYILAFQKQGRKTKWPPRHVPNLPAIVIDLDQKGGNIKERRFKPTPALIDTGRLKNSGATRLVGTTIYWGTNVPYGGLHQWGGKSIIESKIPDKLDRPNIKRGLNLLRKRGFTQEASFLSRTRRWVIKVPARPFLEITEDDYIAFQEAIYDGMLK